jgi:hypothetical protein
MFSLLKSLLTEFHLWLEARPQCVPCSLVNFVPGRPGAVVGAMQRTIFQAVFGPSAVYTVFDVHATTFKTVVALALGVLLLHPPF